jgi:hypothetical protein
VSGILVADNGIGLTMACWSAVGLARAAAEAIDAPASGLPPAPGEDADQQRASNI